MSATLALVDVHAAAASAVVLANGGSAPCRKQVAPDDGAASECSEAATVFGAPGSGESSDEDSITVGRGRSLSSSSSCCYGEASRGLASEGGGGPGSSAASEAGGGGRGEAEEEETSLEEATQELLQTEGVSMIDRAVACVHLVDIAAHALQQQQQQRNRSAADVLAYVQTEVEASAVNLAALALQLAADVLDEDQRAQCLAGAQAASPEHLDVFDRAVVCAEMLGEVSEALPRDEAGRELSAYVEDVAGEAALSLGGLLMAISPELDRRAEASH